MSKGAKKKIRSYTTACMALVPWYGKMRGRASNLKCKKCLVDGKSQKCIENRPEVFTCILQLSLAREGEAAHDGGTQSDNSCQTTKYLHDFSKYFM
jgi:hypothetical protein